MRKEWDNYTVDTKVEQVGDETTEIMVKLRSIETGKTVGSASAYIIPVDRMSELEMHDAFDGISAAAQAAYYVLEKAETFLFAEIDTVIYVSEVNVRPKHRGKDLGHFIINELAQMFGYGGCGVFVLYASSLEDRRKETQDTSTKKLTAYWRRMGFETIEGTIMKKQFFSFFYEEKPKTAANVLSFPSSP